MPANATDSFRSITDALSQSLKQAFDEVCPERYGGPLTLVRVDPASDAPAVSFRVEGGIQRTLRLHVTVAHVGGNVYDITTQVEDGPSHCFTHSVADSSGASLCLAPHLGKKIARHLLDEVERQLGKDILRHEMMAEA